MINLRPIRENDYELTLAWRNDPDIYKGFYMQGRERHIITWEEHWNWNRYRPSTWRTFIVEADPLIDPPFEDDKPDRRRIGVVTIGQLDHWGPELGYYIGEKALWGKGLGTEAVSQALEWLRAYGKWYARLTILDDNTSSIRLATKLGFQRISIARPGESLYQKYIVR